MITKRSTFLHMPTAKQLSLSGDVGLMEAHSAGKHCYSKGTKL